MPGQYGGKAERCKEVTTISRTFEEAKIVLTGVLRRRKSGSEIFPGTATWCIGNSHVLWK